MKTFGRAIALAGLAGSLLTSAALAADAPGQGDVRGQGRGQDQASGASEDCVQVRQAGHSGLIQVRGGGVHLIVEAPDEDDRETKDLEALADKVADAVCASAAAEKKEADAATAADKLDGMEVVHQNTYGPED